MAMNRNDSRVGWTKSVVVAKRAIPLLVPIGLLAVVLAVLLLVPNPAQAGLKTTHWVDAWDYTKGQYAHSLINVAFNGTWVPFIHQKDWDTILVTTTVGPPACQITGTQYAGTMYYTLGHTDTNGAMGWRETNHWRLIDCDLNQDGSVYDKDDKVIFPGNGTNNPPPYPGLDLAPCSPGDPICDLVSQDVVQACSQGTCAYEIQTTFFLNLDPDCDGTPDILPADGDPSSVCFYAEALTPKLTATDIVWGGNLQTRITEAGGDKTVNFHVEDWPTAVELAAFDVEAQGDDIVLSWQTATELDNLGFNIYRADSADGPQTRVNERLIPAQGAGDVGGASYSFVDETAATGRTYYYWLEDVDVDGVATKDGPVEVSVPAGKALPGRPRPEPIPAL
jgi:hypothetical protein